MMSPCRSELPETHSHILGLPVVSENEPHAMALTSASADASLNAAHRKSHLRRPHHRAKGLALSRYTASGSRLGGFRARCVVESPESPHVPRAIGTRFAPPPRHRRG